MLGQRRYRLVVGLPGMSNCPLYIRSGEATPAKRTLANNLTLGLSWCRWNR